MYDNDKFAIAARLYVLLRRKANRSIDTVWMLSSNEYAREVLRIARAQTDADLDALVRQFEALMTEAVAPTPDSSQVSFATKSYIGTLR